MLTFVPQSLFILNMELRPHRDFERHREGCYSDFQLSLHKVTLNKSSLLRGLAEFRQHPPPALGLTHFSFFFLPLQPINFPQD